MLTLLISSFMISLISLFIVFAIYYYKRNKVVSNHEVENLISVKDSWRRNYQIWFVGVIVLTAIVVAIPISQKVSVTYDSTEIAQFDDGTLYKENDANSYFLVKTNNWNPIVVVSREDVDVNLAEDVINKLAELETLENNLKTFH